MHARRLSRPLAHAEPDYSQIDAIASGKAAKAGPAKGGMAAGASKSPVKVNMDSAEALEGEIVVEYAKTSRSKCRV